MSVYKRKGYETFDYDFHVGGHRFTGNTGETEKRKARTREALERDAARKRVEGAAKLNAPKVWVEARSRWLEEVGQHHVQIAQTLDSLEWLDRHIGTATNLIDIDDNLVARLVARRRAEKRRGNGWTRDEPVSAATVNRTVTEPLRKVMLRAQKVWRVPVGFVDWSSHMLAEPQERVREASPGEEAAIMSELGRGYDTAMRFSFNNGLRRMEVIGLKKTMVDFFNRQFTVIGKGSKTRTIPMSEESYDVLWDLRNTPTDYVFTYVAARTNRAQKVVKGQHYPLTQSGFQTAQRRAIARGGVTNFRPHDTRHTAATRVLRKSNLKVVQKLLGHRDVTTTTKYAHAMQEDIRAALDAASPAKSPATGSGDIGKILKDQGE